MSTGCVIVCGSKRTRPAPSSARSSSQPATGGIAPAAYHPNAVVPAIAPGTTKTVAREAEVAQHGEPMLEHIAIAVVERERDRGLTGRQREIADLVEVDDALTAGGERLHLTAERIGRHGERVAIARDAVVVEDAQAGANRAAAHDAGERLPTHQRRFREADRRRAPDELRFRAHRFPLWSRTALG